MDTFANALISEKTDLIPTESDWFAPLLGDWDFDYYDHFENETPRHLEGEWIFRRVLNGAGIEDLFICPSRSSRIEHPQPDGEYGAAVRMFNAQKKCYDMFYACEHSMTRLEFKKEDDKLVGTIVDNTSAKWVFCEIKEDTFHWQNVTVLEDGSWKINVNIYGKRRK